MAPRPHLPDASPRTAAVARELLPRPPPRPVRQIPRHQGNPAGDEDGRHGELRQDAYPLAH